ncbi:hypothetical protein D5086_031760 [Populus alba]|uniref:Uncharacterized protein n=1 Tax=Populus alba TaxID=43335 RepID=A0ACC4AJK7_POPAL
MVSLKFKLLSFSVFIFEKGASSFPFASPSATIGTPPFLPTQCTITSEKNKKRREQRQFNSLGFARPLEEGRLITEATLRRDTSYGTSDKTSRYFSACASLATYHAAAPGQVRPAIQPLPGSLHMDPSTVFLPVSVLLAPYNENASIDERDGFRNGVEKVKPVSDKHIDLLRPSARYYATSKGQVTDATDGEKGKYTLVRDPEDFQGIYDKPLPCFGCGIGWFSFLLGFVFPLMWYYGTFLYFGNYYRKDPRERAGLAAAAIGLIVLCSRLGNPLPSGRAQRMLIRECSFTVGDYLHGYIETFTNS